MVVPAAAGDTSSEFGVALRRYRERAGLSQNGLAAAAGTDPGTVNRLESGKRAPVNRGLIDRLSGSLRLANGERDCLLALAGHLPDPLARLGIADPDLLLMADILSDTLIPQDERIELRTALRIIARRWRARTASDAGPDSSPAVDRQTDRTAVRSQAQSDWGCWL